MLYFIHLIIQQFGNFLLLHDVFAFFLIIEDIIVLLFAWMLRMILPSGFPSWVDHGTTKAKNTKAGTGFGGVEAQ